MSLDASIKKLDAADDCLNQTLTAYQKIVDWLIEEDIYLHVVRRLNSKFRTLLDVYSNNLSARKEKGPTNEFVYQQLVEVEKLDVQAKKYLADLNRAIEAYNRRKQRLITKKKVHFWSFLGGGFFLGLAIITLICYVIT